MWSLDSGEWHFCFDDQYLFDIVFNLRNEIDNFMFSPYYIGIQKNLNRNKI